MKVRIEKQCLDHVQGLHAVLSDPKIYKYLDENPPKDVEEVRNRILLLSNGGPPDDSEIWLNWCVLVDNVIVGYVQATIPNQGPTSVAFVIGSRWWGQGVAWKACRAMLEELSNYHGITHFVADTESGNKKSQSLLERLGFKKRSTRGNELFYELN